MRSQPATRTRSGPSHTPKLTFRGNGVWPLREKLNLAAFDKDGSRAFTSTMPPRAKDLSVLGLFARLCRCSVSKDVLVAWVLAIEGLRSAPKPVVVRFDTSCCTLVWWPALGREQERHVSRTRIAGKGAGGRQERYHGLIKGGPGRKKGNRYCGGLEQAKGRATLVDAALLRHSLFWFALRQFDKQGWRLPWQLTETAHLSTPRVAQARTSPVKSPLRSKPDG